MLVTFYILLFSYGLLSLVTRANFFQNISTYRHMAKKNNPPYLISGSRRMVKRAFTQGTGFWRGTNLYFSSLTGRFQTCFNGNIYFFLKTSFILLVNIFPSKEQKTLQV